MYRELKSGRNFKKTLFFLIKDYYPRNDHKTNRHNRENGGERERERERAITSISTVTTNHS
jgi:hypothetical protein